MVLFCSVLFCSVLFRSVLFSELPWTVYSGVSVIWDCFGLALYRFTKANRTQSIKLCSIELVSELYRTQSDGLSSIEFDLFGNRTH